MAEYKLLDKKELDKFGKDYVKILTKYLLKYKKRASGNLIKSLDYRIQIIANDGNIALLSDDYLENVDKGRKRGTYPNIKDIGKWAQIKGIPQSAVFPIAKSIFKFGIKPTNIIQQAIREYENPTQISKYEDVLVKNVEKRIDEIITKEQNKK